MDPPPRSLREPLQRLLGLATGEEELAQEGWGHAAVAAIPGSSSALERRGCILDEKPHREGEA